VGAGYSARANSGNISLLPICVHLRDLRAVIPVS